MSHIPSKAMKQAIAPSPEEEKPAAEADVHLSRLSLFGSRLREHPRKAAAAAAGLVAAGLVAIAAIPALRARQSEGRPKGGKAKAGKKSARKKS